MKYRKFFAFLLTLSMLCLAVQTLNFSPPPVVKAQENNDGKIDVKDLLIVVKHYV